MIVKVLARFSQATVLNVLLLCLLLRIFAYRHSSDVKILKTLIACLLIALSTDVAAQFSPLPPAASCSEFDCRVSLPDEHLGRYLGLDYRMEFHTLGMATRQVRMQWPVAGLGYLAGNYSHFGDNDYHVQRAWMEYRLRVSPAWRIGAGAEWCHAGTADSWYRPEQWLSARLSLQYVAGSKLSFGLFGATAPWKASQRWVGQAEMRYSPGTKLCTYVGAIHDSGWRLYGHTEYCLTPSLVVGAGVCSNPLLASCNIGLRTGRLRIDIGSTYHSRLGLTPQISLALCI